MRLAFWRPGKDKDVVQRAMAKAAAAVQKPAAVPVSGDLDLHALGQALMRKRGWIVVPTVLAAVLSLATVNLVTPRYKSEVRILIDGRENVFLRPNGERNEERNALDAEAVTSQVQLLLSRDLAREIIKKNKLAERPEFDPGLQARVAKWIAEGYLVRQQNARQEEAKAASQWLSGEIDNLRKKVSEAESRVEDFRSKSSLFVGTNNTTLSNQQMGELNTQLNNARALKSEAESKARLIREMLQNGRPIEASEVLNSELIRRLSEQRVTLRGQLAEQSSTLLDNHPRIKELKAQVADLDRQLREEAGKISRSLDNDARIAGGRVEGLSASLEQLKKQATSTNGQDVQLRAMDREPKPHPDPLAPYLPKYREANTRENIDAAPADGRIISRATVSNDPAYPKKLPIVLIATLATLMLSAGTIATGELLRMTAPRAIAAFASSAAPVRAPAAAAAVATADPAPMFSETRPEIRPQPAADIPTELTDIERLAARLRGAGEAARKVTILGTASSESITLTALTLARLMARHARVVVVDLSASSPTMSAVSADPAAPGLAELMLGEASFSQVITKDKLSRLPLVNSGRPGFDRALLQSPRLTLAIHALKRVYDP